MNNIEWYGRFEPEYLARILDSCTREACPVCPLADFGYCKEWAHAEHVVDDECNTSPVVDDETPISEHNDGKCAENATDSREKLEADIIDHIENSDSLPLEFRDWLDRQAAITRAETIESLASGVEVLIPLGDINESTAFLCATLNAAIAECEELKEKAKRYKDKAVER